MTSKGSKPPIQAAPDIVIDETSFLDGGTTALENRQNALTLARREVAGIQERLALAHYQLGVVFESFKNEAVGAGAKKALDREANIETAAALVRGLQQVMRHLDQILNRFAQPLLVDPQTLEPVLNQGNSLSVAERLDFAIQQFNQMPKSLSSGRAANRELTSAVAPTDALVEDVGRLYFIDGFFEDPKNALQMFKIIDDYLVSILQATQLGIQTTVMQTASQVGNLRKAANNIHGQAEERELYGLEPTSQDLENWKALLEEMELVMARCLVRVLEIYGSNLSVIAKEFDPETIKRLIRELIRMRNNLENQKKEPQIAESTGFLQRVMNLFGENKQESTPALSTAQMRQQLTTVSDRLSSLRALLEANQKPK